MNISLAETVRRVADGFIELERVADVYERQSEIHPVWRPFCAASPAVLVVGRVWSSSREAFLGSTEFAAASLS